MTNLAATRTEPPTGYVAKGGVAELRETFLPVESARDYAEWSDLRTTKLVRKALQDMALNGPGSVDIQDAAVQHGVTVGLNLAVALLTDPSLIFPEVFTGVVARRPEALGQPDYSTGVDALLDRQQ